MIVPYLFDGEVAVGENLAGELIPDEVAFTVDGKGEEQQKNPVREEESLEAL